MTPCAKLSAVAKVLQSIARQPRPVEESPRFRNIFKCGCEVEGEMLTHCPTHPNQMCVRRVGISTSKSEVKP